MTRPIAALAVACATLALAAPAAAAEFGAGLKVGTGLPPVHSLWMCGLRRQRAAERRAEQGRGINLAGEGF